MIVWIIVTLKKVIHIVVVMKQQQKLFPLRRVRKYFTIFRRSCLLLPSEDKIIKKLRIDHDHKTRGFRDAHESPLSSFLRSTLVAHHHHRCCCCCCYFIHSSFQRKTKLLFTFLGSQPNCVFFSKYEWQRKDFSEMYRTDELFCPIHTPKASRK